MSGVILFQRAEGFYVKGDIERAFDHYQKSIKKILKDENVTAPIPAIVPEDFPRELLGTVWRNFVGFFRDPAMSFTQESAPDAYKLLKSFQPSAAKSYPRLERSERGRILLKGMQITAALTLGILAWDKRDRATAAKRYREALDLAATHPPFLALSPGTVGLEKYVYTDLQEVKSNLDHLIQNDVINAQVLANQGEGGEPGRRETVELPQTRIEGTGEVTQNKSVMFATDACAKCGKREVKLLRCSRCKKVSYCGPQCQGEDWRMHKASCKP